MKPETEKISAGESRLRELIDYVSDELCQSVDGNFDFTIKSAAHDETVEKLLMLVNFLLDSARRALAEHEAKALELDAIMESAADGIVTIDERGLIQSANAAAGRIFGYGADEMIGSNVSILMPQQHAVRHSGYIDKHLRTGETNVIGSWRELVGLRKDGTEFPLELSVSKVLFGYRASFTGIVRDVSERKKHEAEREALNKNLVETSRRAGMAEVATGVLHNVGNVLNSVNVSATVISEKLKQSKLPGLAKAMDMIAEHSDDLPGFLSADPQGKQLFDYLRKLAVHLTGEQVTIAHEADSLTKNVEHIKEIVAAQQSHARMSGLVESVKLEDVIADAIEINTASLTRHGVRVITEFEDVPNVTANKQQALQIVINLISNAINAVNAIDVDTKRITVGAALEKDNLVRIDISDNGIGIDEETLSKVFAHGFTTRKDGHGFGLHSGALLAKEMGGALTVESPGVGMGATFSLRLPIERENDSQESA